MSDDKRTLRQLMVGILVFVCPVLILGIIFTNDRLAFILGLSLGTLISFGQLLHMNHTIDKALDMTPKKAQSYSVRNYVIRNVVTIGFLVFAVLVDRIDIIGAIVGTFGVKASAFIHPYINRKNKANKSQGA